MNAAFGQVEVNPLFPDGLGVLELKRREFHALIAVAAYRKASDIDIIGRYLPSGWTFCQKNMIGALFRVVQVLVLAFHD